MINFDSVEQDLVDLGLNIIEKDLERPWGGFFVIDERQTNKFVQLFFKALDFNSMNQFEKLSPKILIVQPFARLSWQYHFRRTELWKVLQGDVGVVRSYNDSEGDMEIHKPGDEIMLNQNERHRLIGLENGGIVAEIWQHLDLNNPSNENDIVRIQDDFGR
jgi:mannose-6-phosphate isomerase